MSRLSAAVGLCLTLALAACQSLPPNAARPPRHDARLITREDIQRSGATDAWDALKRSGNFMSMKEGRGGDLRVAQRGRSSIVLSDEMMLVVDDVVQTDLSALRLIPAQSVDWMRILTGSDATQRYGTPGANGAILVHIGLPEEK
jgi:hypothetical protein